MLSNSRVTMNSRIFAGLIISLSIVSMSLLLPINYRNISINPAFATASSESGTIEYLCLKYKNELSVYDNDCHEMFDNNNVKTDAGWVTSCRVAKFAGNQFPAVVRLVISNIQCHAEPVEQFENIFNRVTDAVTDVSGLFGGR
jgi:hypothetical protein